MQWEKARKRDLLIKNPAPYVRETGFASSNRKKGRRPPKNARLAARARRTTTSLGFATASTVTILHPDGTQETKAAYSSAEKMLEGIGDRPSTRRTQAPAKVTITIPARKTSKCNDCGKTLRPGDLIEWNPRLHQGYCHQRTCRQN